MKKILKSKLGRKFVFGYLILSIVYFIGIVIIGSTLEGWGALALGGIAIYLLMPSYEIFQWIADILHERGMLIEFILPIALNFYFAYLIGVVVEKIKKYNN